MDEYYYAKIAYKGYTTRIYQGSHHEVDHNDLWDQLKDIEKEAWKACTAAITKEVNNYWYRTMKNRGTK